jgi:DNA-binding MarR family transcriptional regulator
MKQTKLSKNQKAILHEIATKGCVLQTDLYTPAKRANTLRAVRSLIERELIVCKKVLYENKRLFLTDDGWRQVLTARPLNRAEWGQQFKAFLDLKASAEELATMALYLISGQHPALAAYRLEVPQGEIIRTVTHLELRQNVELARSEETL